MKRKLEIDTYMTLRGGEQQNPGRHHNFISAVVHKSHLLSSPYSGLPLLICYVDLHQPLRLDPLTAAGRWEILSRPTSFPSKQKMRRLILGVGYRFNLLTNINGKSDLFLLGLNWLGVEQFRLGLSGSNVQWPNKRFRSRIPEWTSQIDWSGSVLVILVIENGILPASRDNPFTSYSHL